MGLFLGHITEEELKHLYYDEKLSDGEIGERYGVRDCQIRYIRKTFDISMEKASHEDSLPKERE